MNKIKAILIAGFFCMTFMGYAQQLEWLENDLFQIDSNSQTMTNAKTGLSYAMTSSILPQGVDGDFEITGFQVNGVAANHPTVSPGAISLYFTPASVTSFDLLEINQQSYSIKLGYIFIDPTYNNSAPYKARVSSPDGTVITESVDITPQQTTKLRFAKVGNSLSIKYVGDQNSTKDIDIGVLNLAQQDYRIIVAVNEEDLSFNYSYNGFDGDPTVVVPTSNDDRNWIISRSYESSGALYGASINYYDCLGKPTQSQSKDILTGKMWADETRYDFQGRPALHSYTSPLTGTPQHFAYKEDFIQTNSGNTLSTTTLEANPEVPPVMGTNAGSLGWYYSSNNDSEPFQDNTNRPYARSVYDELNPGNIRMVSGGKYLDLDGDGSNDTFPQGYAYSLPTAQELYYAFGQDYFNGPIGPEGKEVIHTAFKTIVIDPHGNEVVSFTDREGKILATARSGGTNKYEVVSLIGEQGFVDVHIPKGIVNSDITYLSPWQTYTVWDLRSGDIIPAINMTGGNVYRMYYTPLSDDDAKVHIESNGTINVPANAKGIRYKVNYHNYSLNYYDTSGRLTQSTQPLGFDSQAYNLSTGVPNHSMATTYEYNALGELLYANGPDEGYSQFVYRADGQIRFSRNSQQLADGKFSYTEYDERGRPVESGICQGDLPYFNVSGTVTPTFNVGSSLSTGTGSVTKTGASNWVNSAFSSQESTGTGDFTIPFTFTTNTKGAIGISETNAGSGYLSIDFSVFLDSNQIGVQHNGASLARNLGTYDGDDLFEIKRTSGSVSIYLNGQQIYQIPALSNIATADFFIDGDLYHSGASVTEMEIQSGSQQTPPPPVDEYSLDPNNRTEQIFTVYDENDHAGLQALGFSTDPMQYGSRAQRFLSGNVSTTYTQNPATNKTWYSYDIYGRVEWLVQDINGLGAKTIDYVYDDITGQVAKVIYQRDDSNDLFVHKYMYNDLGQLILIETSRDHINFTEHAKYFYYETGALKRVELAEGLQGIDYIYTLDGRLKAVNHPSLSGTYDPGEDQNDAFGMILEYHERDYTRGGSAINYTSAGTNRYDGNLKGIRWQTQDLNPPGMPISGYLYEYNDSKWLSSATYGSFSNNVFTQNGQGDYSVPYIDYDANGNISTLFRTMSSDSGNNAMDALTYNYNTETNQLNYISDATFNDTGDAGDIKTQASNNYTYNNIGQLISNAQDDIGYNYWATGLAKSIYSTVQGNNESVEFFYNDRGHRIEKRITTNSGDGPKTFYVRDASGKVIAIYTLTDQPDSKSKSIQQTIEYPIYGLSRLGTSNDNDIFTYELPDHLGNVRGVIQREVNATVILNEDFSGSSVPSGWTSSANVNLSISNGELKAEVTDGNENEVSVGFPVTNGNTYSIRFTVNLDETPNELNYIVYEPGGWGLLGPYGTVDQNEEVVVTYNAQVTGTATLTFRLGTTFEASQNNYYLDNVRVTDVTTTSTPVMLAYKDYYPFGMPMPDRNIEGEYRYAFQGQEKDLETGMEAFELRLWDGRIGRWLTPDPYGQFHSSYLGMGNNPVNGVDLDGGIWTPEYIFIGGAAIDITAIKVAYLKVTIDNKVTHLNGVLASGGLSSDEIDDINTRITTLNATKKFIDAIGNDPNNHYKLVQAVPNANGAVEATPTGANTVEIPFDVSTVDDIALTLHEVLHGWQHSRGFLKIVNNGGKYEFSTFSGMELRNEIQGYQVQYSFEPNSVPTQQRAEFIFGPIASSGKFINFNKPINSIKDIDKNFILRLHNTLTNNYIYFPALPRLPVRILTPRFF